MISIFNGLKLPVIAAPMFLTSGSDLVVEACRAGVIGTFPALNCRDSDGLAAWITEITGRLATWPTAAPFGINLIVNRSNTRLNADLDIIQQAKVPLVITSLGAVRDVVDAVHSYGGLVFHDVINRRHAEKAAQAGVDGIIAVSAGAGGHTGAMSPFALVSEIREFFGGTIVLGGGISTGRHIAAARVMGADLAYMGTRFIATQEALAPSGFKEMIIASRAADIVCTNSITGIHANFLRPSLSANGLDPQNLPIHGELALAGEAKPWKTLWSAGHGVGSIADIPTVAQLCKRLTGEYRQALAETGRDQFRASE
jgi:nitronate monooxygenase